MESRLESFPRVSLAVTVGSAFTVFRLGGFPDMEILDI